LLAALALAAATIAPTPVAAATAPPPKAPAGHHDHQLAPLPVDRPRPGTAPALPVKNGPLSITPGALGFAAATDTIAMRLLVIAKDGTDFGLPTWKAVLDRIGTPYDVLLARSDPFDAGRLVRSDGSGRYSGVLLTDNALLYADSSGNFVSALTPAKWNLLWDYERNYKVRQVSLYTSYGTFPEDYCLRPGTEGAIGASTPTALTSQGARVFDYLVPSAQVPIQQSYAYRAALAPNCAAQPTLKIDDSVVGVLSTSADGRERAALTFSSHQNLLQTDLLGYGLVRWATKGVFLGERRHWLNVDVDDWFNATEHLYADGHLESSPGFRLSGPEALSAQQQQAILRTEFPQASGFTLNLAYNGSGLDPAAPSQCSSVATPDPLTSFSRCVANNFRWINHTMSHPQMDFTSYAESYAEINDNLLVAQRAGIQVPRTVLKTPAYSGLGVYIPNPNAPDGTPPTDFGLSSSNRNLLRAANDIGVRVLQGNMSFPSQVPACFNCGIYHPLQPNQFIVPGWPTNVSYQATTPAEEAVYFNRVYGPHGTFPYFDHDLSYGEILNSETEVALQHVLSGSAYTHTFHQGNLHEFSPGRSLVFDWLTVLLGKYSTYYKVPLETPDWTVLAGYAQLRNAHFTALASGRDAVWNRATNQITYVAGSAGTLFSTGASGGPGTTTTRYGSDLIAHTTFTAGSTVTLTAAPRP
jgi:hypothetical protein